MGTRSSVLVDQHPLWLEAVELVARRADVDVLGKTTSPTLALALLEEQRPDMLVTGITMPPGEMDGVALIRRARERVPGLKAIVLSMYDDPEHIDAAFAAGASAYVVKTAHPEDVASAIRQAFRHSVFIAGERETSLPVPPAPMPSGPPLTRRELEILQLVAEGHSNAELARMLWVTEQTVKFHLSNIYRKLNVSNRTEASRWAQIHGVLPPARAGTSAA